MPDGGLSDRSAGDELLTWINAIVFQ